MAEIRVKRLIMFLSFRMIDSYFKIADKSKDKHLNFEEMANFLESVNFKIKKQDLKYLIKVIVILY